MTHPPLAMDALAAELELGPETSVLTFDVRAFFAHSKGHVRSSVVNIGLPRVLARQKPVRLGELEPIIRKEQRGVFRARGTYSLLVVYDDVVESAGSVRPAAVLAGLLRAERADRPHTVHLLEGAPPPLRRKVVRGEAFTRRAHDPRRCSPRRLVQGVRAAVPGPLRGGHGDADAGAGARGAERPHPLPLAVRLGVGAERGQAARLPRLREGRRRRCRARRAQHHPRRQRRGRVP